jgi:CheY-like chemotaxis protein
VAPRLPLLFLKRQTCRLHHQHGKVRIARGLRILVVDDDADSCNGMAVTLQLRGYDASAAFGGPDAIRQVATLNPNLVLLDLSMPGMDGVDVARVVRQMELGAQPIIAAVSGYTTHYHQRMCAEAGFDHYLPKPVEPAALDHFLWMVDETRVLREAAGILRREHRAAAYALALSQMEFEAVLLESVDKLQDVQARRDCLAKARQLQARTAKWLDKEGSCSPDQKAKLQIMLAALRDRLADMQA